jgi:hypothetical protein
LQLKVYGTDYRSQNIRKKPRREQKYTKSDAYKPDSKKERLDYHTQIYLTLQETCQVKCKQAKGRYNKKRSSTRFKIITKRTWFSNTDSIGPGNGCVRSGFFPK